MSFLVPADYRKSIQTENLTQVTANDPTIIAAAEATAVEEAKSYLVQKYDVSGIVDVLTYDNATAYQAGQLVTDGTDLYFGKYPQPGFLVGSYYNVGDLVFWKNKVYTCRTATIDLSRTGALQYIEVQDLPLRNVFPDDAKDGLIFWGTGTPYSIAAATPLSDTSKWVKGDNRSAQLVTCICNIALYYCHLRIAPRNIPELRVKAYDDAIRWLKGCADGKFTPALTKLQPNQGGRIRYGGNIKNRNVW
jgi:hypothetical protein